MSRNLIIALTLLVGTAGPVLAEGTHEINAWGARFEVQNAPVDGGVSNVPSYGNPTPASSNVLRAYSSLKGNIEAVPSPRPVPASTRTINVWGAHFDVPTY